MAKIFCMMAAMAVAAMLTWQAEAVRMMPRVLLQAVTCPADPRALCDFGFMGYNASVPTFSLDGPADTPLVPGVIELANGTYVSISNTGNGKVLTGCPATMNTTGGQFYLTGYPTSLQFRNFNLNKTFFANLCVSLPLYHINVGQLNLSPGDNSTLYPESRRCVIFQTSSNTTQCASPSPSLPPSPPPSPPPSTPPSTPPSSRPPPPKKTPPPPPKKNPPPMKRTPPPAPKMTSPPSLTFSTPPPVFSPPPM